MFRDLYKNANENIKGDKAILEEVYKRASEKEKGHTLLFRYSFVGTAVAAVILMGALFVNSDIFMTKTKEMSELKLPDEDNVIENDAAKDENSQIMRAEVTDEVISVDDGEEELYHKEAVEEKTTENGTAEKKTESAVKNDAVLKNELSTDKENNPQLTQKGEDTKAIIDEDMEVGLFILEDGEDELYDTEISEHKTISEDEFYSYLGVDLRSITYPAGMMGRVNGFVQIDGKNKFIAQLDEEGNVVKESIVAVVTASDASGEKKLNAVVMPLTRKKGGEFISEKDDIIKAYIESNTAKTDIEMHGLSRMEAELFAIQFE